MVSADGGRAKPLTTLDPGRFEIHHAFPQAVDGGRLVLFTVRTRSKEAPLFVDVFDVATQTRRSLVPGAHYARYLPTGHLLYVRERTLYAMKVAAETLSPEGPAVPVLTDVHSGPAGEALVSISADGTLLYVEAEPPTERIACVGHSGRNGDRNGAADAQLPDSARIATRWPDRRQHRRRRDHRYLDGGRGPGTLERLTFGRSVNFTFPGFAFAPDGSRLAYSEDAEGGTVVMTQTIDGAREKEAVLDWKMPIAPSRWLPDGSGLLLDARGPTTGGDLLVATSQSGQQPTMLTSEEGNQWGGSPSADGRYLAYASNETGRFEVWVMAYPPSGLKRQVTTEGGGRTDLEPGREGDLLPRRQSHHGHSGDYDSRAGLGPVELVVRRIVRRRRRRLTRIRRWSRRPVPDDAGRCPAATRDSCASSSTGSMSCGTASAGRRSLPRRSPDAGPEARPLTAGGSTDLAWRSSWTPFQGVVRSRRSFVSSNPTSPLELSAPSAQTPTVAGAVMGSASRWILDARELRR